jgi:cytoskeletal protein RodZ
MLRKIRKRIAQSTLEYAVLVVVVIGALLSIQAYLKRGVMGKIKTSTDESISAEQYDPQNMIYTKNTTTTSSTREISTHTGSSTTLTAPEETTVNAFSNTITSP